MSRSAIACVVMGILTLVFGGLRLTVPGHDVFTWGGTYEAFVHMFLGALITLAFVTKERWWYVGFLVLLTLWEGWVMMSVQGHQVTGWMWR